MSHPRRSSLAVNVPLVLSLLLAVSFGGMTLAVYLEMRGSVIAVSGERLAHASRQISDLLATSARSRCAAIQSVARQQPIRDKVFDPAAADEPVVNTFAKYLGPQRNAASVELWDADGVRLVAAGNAVSDLKSADKAILLDAFRVTGRPVVSRFYRDGDSLAYSVVVPLREGETTNGYVVDRRRLAGNASQALMVLVGMIGDGARVLVGDGAVWSDLTAIVDGPTRFLPAAGLIEYERGGAGSAFAFATRIPDTPWFVVVELPQPLVLEPVRRFLRRSIAVSLLVVGAAALVGWSMSRRLTTPLRQVSDAAEAIAADLPAARLDLHRDDEIGRLATSFNTMADRVEHSRQRFESLVRELEDRVEERTAALRTANADLESFSYSVSHDLRAPLRAIGGFAKILAEDHGDQLPPDAMHCLAVIDRNIQHMAHLIDDLLILSRLGRQALTRRPVNMQALASELAAEITRTETGRIIEFAIDALPEANGEASLIHQVLLNLLQNAAKFTRGRSPAVIEVGVHEQHGELIYFVRDNGAGFDMRYAGKLFGVFQRLHRSSEFEGTGVGLAIVQRVIHRHGGRVWAEAAVGKGATFFFTLAPAAGDAQESTAGEKRSSAVTNHQAGSIGLAVDDHGHDRRVGDPQTLDPSHA